ncbi:CBS domain-containing protein [Nitrincola tapanii]|uniref:CBS domain-containing protein n=1 Tax=Nitrincola tapanii TaxID=1708751 RepID=A0A5A9W2F0_9GAMM|nr:CBS domain-containing protein [Nitrincola tapanii]KAA0874970.1 CBS domain-containing protein [Nitrincola tapanii]
MLRSVKAQDYMATKLVTFKPTTDLFVAINALREYNLSGTPVVDDEGSLVGILSEVDCLRAILSQTYHEQEMGSGGHVGDFMTANVDTVPHDADIIAVSSMFIERGRRSLPVVKAGKLVGMITRSDVLRAVEDFAKDG